MADYTLMSEDEFDAILEEIVAGMGASQVLTASDVCWVLREVLSRWEDRNPEKAFPDTMMDSPQ
jgi:hypothetical protein